MGVSIHKPHNENAGFSALELVVRLAVIMLAATLAIGALQSERNARTLEEATAQTLALLREARSRTLSSDAGMQFGVRFESSGAILFQGSAFVDGAPENRTVGFGERVHVSTTLPNESVVFGRLTGQSSGVGTVVLALTSDATIRRTVAIEESGITYAE
jgi:type II secretory pathway pseudopilin PulG